MKTATRRPRVEQLEDRLVPANLFVFDIRDDVNLEGTLRNAIRTANSNNEDDVITFSGAFDGSPFVLNGVLNLTEAGRKVTIRGIVNHGTLDIVRSVLAGNVATGDGGGLNNFFTADAARIINSTVSNNVSNRNGGGLVNGPGALILRNVTVVVNVGDGNNDGDGRDGGITEYRNGKTQLFNSIVTGNTSRLDTRSPFDIGGTVDAASTNNLIGDANSAGGLSNNYNGTSGNIVGVATSAVLDPSLPSAAGSTTQFHALVAGSLAANAGNAALAVDKDGNALTTDQRGGTFSRTLGGRIDLGAAESTFESGQFTFVGSAVVVDETIGTFNVTIRRDNGSSGIVRVSLGTRDGTATSPSDYQANGALLVFANGETSQTVTVNVRDDGFPEATETYDVVLSNPTNGASLGSFPTLTVRINDDDSFPAPNVTVDLFDLGAGTASAPAEGVLGNDSHLLGATIQATLATPAALGQANLAADGSFTYTRGASFWGVDTFTYTATFTANGFTGPASAPATVTVVSHEALQVRKIYNSVLGRDPDLGGWRFWTDQVTSRTASPGTVASGIFESPERLSPIISQFYRDFLLREPDAGGLAFWRGIWTRDGGPENVVGGMASSPEFFQSAGSTSRGFVTKVYERVLARAAESGGLTYWTGELDAGRLNRFGVVLGISSSPEYYRNQTIGWYNQYLNRAATTAEIDAAVTALFARRKTQRDVQIEILDGREYYTTPPEPGAGQAVRVG